MLLHHSIPTKIVEAVDITENTTIFVVEEDAVLNAEEIGDVSEVVGDPLI